MQSFSWKAFPTWELPCVWWLYQHYVQACLWQVNLHFFGLHPEVSGIFIWHPFQRQTQTRPVSCSFWKHLFPNECVEARQCGTSSEQCCRQCCDIKGGKGRGWNKATESYRFWILRKVHPIFNAAAFSVLCKTITRISWQQLTLCLLQTLLKVQDQPRTFYWVYKELLKKAIRVQMNLKPKEHFHH